MKITIRPEKHTKRVLTYSKIAPGTVFEYETGIVALKLACGDAVLLKYSNSESWFDFADGYKTMPIVKILGKLVEIVVQE